MNPRARTGPGRDDVVAVLATALPRTRRAAAGQLFGAIGALSAVALIATSAYLITRAAEQPPILYLSMAVVGVRAFALSRAFFRYLERLAGHDAAFRQLETVRIGLLRRLIPLAPAALGQSRRGSVLSALVSDVDELQNLPLRVIQPLVTSLGVATAAVWGVALLSPSAAVGLAVCLVAAFGFGSVGAHRMAASAERSIAPHRAALLDALLDYLTNLDVLVAYGAEDQARARVSATDRTLTSALTRRSLGAGIAAAVLSLFSGLAVAVALLAGIPALSSGVLTGPALVVIALVPLAVFEIIAMVPLAVGTWRQVRVSAERIARIAPVTAPATIASGGLPAGTAVRRPAPAIELTGVHVRWPASTVPALVVDRLRIEEGERVLIEGASGAGKTTLAHLLVRFLDFDGDFRLWGRDVRTLGDDSVRSAVGLCEQSPYLFDESVRQNLLFAREDATDDELLDVLGRVGLGEWVRERGGLDARVGERGALVSGGQAQRIALARALLRDFHVIVFDEPTANVEADLADALLDDLLAASGAKDRTVILISHSDIAPGAVDRRLRISGGVLKREHLPAQGSTTARGM